jgi:hypothetical protein
LLLISQPTVNACVHVIDGDMPVYSASERLIVEKAGRYSNTKWIVPEGEPPVPPRAIFGGEPERGWCYYYQQAGLARQRGDWQRVVELYDAAESQGLRAGDDSEYFVFVEGLVNAGGVERAQAIVTDTIRENPALRFSLCDSLERAPEYPAAFRYRRDEIEALVCGPSEAAQR